MALYVERNHRRRRESPLNLVFAIPRERTQQAILPTHSRFKHRWFQRPGNALCCRREAEREAMSFRLRAENIRKVSPSDDQLRKHINDSKR